MVAPPEIDGLPPAGLKQVMALLPSKNAAVKRTIGELRVEIARLKGPNDRPQLRPSEPSGMDQATPRPRRADGRGRGKVTPRVRG